MPLLAGRPQETQLLIADIQVPVEHGLEKAASDAYDELFFQLEGRKLKPMRIWNSFPRINEGADERGEGPEERYKQFNAGRRAAWQRFDPTLSSICAATGIGDHNQEDVLNVRCLASSDRLVHVENPNQISFLDYSERYGTPPSSRRGTLCFGADGVEFYVAGTASITGERNRHAGDGEEKDVMRQLDQTMENIRALIARENLERQCPEDLQSRIPEYRIRDMKEVRVYLREAGYYVMAQKILEGTHGLDPACVEYRLADICRRPLDVEVEGRFDRM